MTPWVALDGGGWANLADSARSGLELESDSPSGVIRCRRNPPGLPSAISGVIRRKLARRPAQKPAPKRGIEAGAALGAEIGRAEVEELGRLKAAVEAA